MYYILLLKLMQLDLLYKERIYLGYACCLILLNLFCEICLNYNSLFYLDNMKLVQYFFFTNNILDGVKIKRDFLNLLKQKMVLEVTFSENGKFGRKLIKKNPTKQFQNSIANHKCNQMLELIERCFFLLFGGLDGFLTDFEY